MQCKKHPSDLSSKVGICASCLRQRLRPLMTAQAQTQMPYSSAAAAFDYDDSRKSLPDPLLFPRSVSPYVAPTHRRRLSFFSTPQVGPTYYKNHDEDKKTKQQQGRFSLLSKLLLRSGSEKFRPDPDHGRNYCLNDVASCPSSSSAFYRSPSCFSTLFSPSSSPSTRPSKMQSSDISSGCVIGRKPPPRMLDGGMSAARRADIDDNHNLHPSGRGLSSKLSSSHWWKRTPVAPPTSGAAVRREKTGHVPSSGSAFCLSPLVRASSNQHRDHQGGGSDGLPPDIEDRVTAPNLSTAPNGSRTRRLCDFGRVNRNRR